MLVSKMLRLGIPFIILVAAGLAHADIVYLTNGGVLEGKVRYVGNTIIVESASGYVTLPVEKVDHVEVKKGNVEEFDDRLAALTKANAGAAEFVALAQFAGTLGMNSRAEIAYKRALSMDTDCAAARVALGFEKFQGQWMTSDDANAARGLVKHNGAWVTPQALEGILKAETQADLLRAQAELAKAKAELERLQGANLDRKLELARAEPSQPVEPVEITVADFDGQDRFHVLHP